MFDAHIHLDQYEHIDEQIDNWKYAGIKGVVAVSSDLRSSYTTLALKQRYPDFIFAAVGFHPEQPLPLKQDKEEWERLVQTEQDHIAAIGEVGLPYYTLSQRQGTSLEHYIDFLDYMVEIAVNKDLPIVLHAVHSHVPIAYELLVKHKAAKAHFHWLKAKEDDVARIVQSGYYISVTPEICYRNRDVLLTQRIPLQQLLIETDGPWPFSGHFEGRQTSPLFLKEMIDKIGEIKNVSFQMAATQLLQNTIALYQRKIGK